MREEAETWVEYYKRNPDEPLQYDGAAEFLRCALVQFASTRERCGRVCIEIAAGSGRRNVVLLRQFAELLVLHDVSFDSVSTGKGDRVGESRVVGDAIELCFKDGCADYIVACDLFMHLRGWRQYLREIKRVLRPGGLLFFNWLGLRDCQRERAAKVGSGWILPPGVPVAFRDDVSGARMVGRAGLNIIQLNHFWRHDPPHPEFFDQPHVHDEWSMVCSK